MGPVRPKGFARLQNQKTKKMAKISWSPERRLMCVSMGDQEFPLTYSLFEKVERGLVTPSMYLWMTAWIQRNASAEQLALAMNWPDQIAEDAHHAYHDLPWQTRINLHTEMTAHLVEERDNFEKAERELRHTDNPFYPTSPVHSAYNAWANTKIAEYSRMAMHISDELDEEELWEFGGEDGASQTDGPRYDEMDEP